MHLLLRGKKMSTQSGYEQLRAALAQPSAVPQKHKLGAIAVVVFLWGVFSLIALIGSGYATNCFLYNGLNCSTYSTAQQNLMKISVVLFWINFILTLIIIAYFLLSKRKVC